MFSRGSARRERRQLRQRSSRGGPKQETAVYEEDTDGAEPEPMSWNNLALWATCICCPLADKVAGNLLSSHFGDVFCRRGELAWRAAGIVAGALALLFGRIQPSAGSPSNNGLCSLLWSSAAYAMLMIPAGKALCYWLMDNRRHLISLEEASTAAGAVLVGPIMAGICSASVLQAAYGSSSTEVSILAPIAAIITTVLQMLPLPPYPVVLTMHIIAVLLALCTMYYLPRRLKPSILLWLVLVPISAWAQGFRNAPYAPEPDFQVRWHGEAFNGGFLSIVTAGSSDLSYTVMKMDHSLLGGIYASPEEFKGECIYSIFHVQEAVLLVNRALSLPSNATLKALVVGLGPGSAARGLQLAGLTVDVMELHREVVQMAIDYFDWVPNGKVWTMNADAAISMQLRLEGEGVYDFLLHDVYSGGSLPEYFFSVLFLKKAARLLAMDGVMAVNYFGSLDENLQLVGRTLQSVLGHVRCFGDEHTSSKERNFVFIAARKPISFRSPTLLDFRDSPMRAEAFRTFLNMEVQLLLDEKLGILDGIHHRLDKAAQTIYAKSHWSTMRSIFPTSFWTDTF